MATHPKTKARKSASTRTVRKAPARAKAGAPSRAAKASLAARGLRYAGVGSEAVMRATGRAPCGMSSITARGLWNDRVPSRTRIPLHQRPVVVGMRRSDVVP